MSFTQEQFERLSSLMNAKGVNHEAFELLADLRQSEMVAKQEVVAITDSIVVALAGLTDFEGLPVSELNYLQVIRKLKEDVMEKTEMMKKYEDYTGETLEEAEERGKTLAFLSKYTRWWLEAKAEAYDRIMSGGKKTLKEWANIFGMAVAVDQNGEAACFAHVPVMYLDGGEGIWTNSPDHYGEDVYLLPTNLIDFDGDWKDSLTLPDEWEEKQ